MPDVLPVVRRAAGWAQPRFEPSANLAPPTRIFEFPSQGRLEGNVTGGGELKTVHVLTGVESLEAELFENKAALKLLTSQVAMHLVGNERDTLFAAIDRLLSVENWEDESATIDTKAFQSFLRCIIYAHPHRLPNMGVGPGGSVLAAWHKHEKTVQVEFLAGDQCIALIKL